MPRRKCGGRYRNAGKRDPSALELAELDREKALKELEKQVNARKEAIRQRALARMSKGEIEKEEEVKKKKILNALLSGKKGTRKKFFTAWLAGIKIIREERKAHEREFAWRTCCGPMNVTCPGGCSACLRLGSTSFEMPFDIFRKTSQSFFTKSQTATLSFAGLNTGHALLQLEDSTLPPLKVQEPPPPPTATVTTLRRQPSRSALRSEFRSIDTVFESVL